MILYHFVFFFFQAEDGIRDLVRSRGLGDVYKRQVSTQSTGNHRSATMESQPEPTRKLRRRRQSWELRPDDTADLEAPQQVTPAQNSSSPVRPQAAFLRDSNRSSPVSYQHSLKPGYRRQSWDWGAEEIDLEGQAGTCRRPPQLAMSPTVPYGRRKSWEWNDEDLPLTPSDSVVVDIAEDTKRQSRKSVTESMV
eukprot:TRINITY_DN3184_c0_g1_i1.p1 TRINITY_DN3184_c0_g1~~TRINITY_DN3184_c0_g1_i1.p1  ORF type:complete len:194 (+),score=22.95 TRINITY_DN3184_c0_g1_i1:58-639(+)